MNEIYDITSITALDVWVAITEIFPDSTYGAVPTSEQLCAFEACRDYADAAGKDVPSALHAYLRNRLTN